MNKRPANDSSVSIHRHAKYYFLDGWSVDVPALGEPIVCDVYQLMPPNDIQMGRSVVLVAALAAHYSGVHMKEFDFLAFGLNYTTIPAFKRYADSLLLHTIGCKAPGDSEALRQLIAILKEPDQGDVERTKRGLVA